jgi:hypothetical protein
MAYKHKYVTGSTYSFYNNSSTLEDDVNFNYWLFSLVHSDSFIPVYEDIATLTKDIISGTDYRWYVDSFVFPSVENGCYRFIVEDTISGNVFYISDQIEVVDSDEGLMLVKYRNAKNILNYDYETLTTFYNQFHIEMFKRKPQRPETTEGYSLVDGSFKRVRTVLTKTYEFITGWFDEPEHDATHAMTIHSTLDVAYGGNYNAMNKPDNSDYNYDWQDNYEFIQGSVRLEEDDKSSSNKAL